MQRIVRTFAEARGPARLALLAVLLGLPALGLGFQTDDHLVRWSVAHGAPPWELFRMTPEFIAARRTSGFFPWWASETYELSFFRPLSSLSHALEFTLYPHSPALMLLTNVLVYAAMVYVAALLYRRLLADGFTAGLAGLMFAVDEAHAPSVGWISGRNTALAALFSLLALHCTVRGPNRWNGALSTICVALALLSAEAGAWSLALLFVLHPLREADLKTRLRALAPQLAVAGLWALHYVLSGRGARGSDWYRDPRELATLMAGVADLPLWIAGLFGPTGMSLSILAPSNLARLVALPIALLLLWLLLPTLRRVAEGRRFLVAALACLAPVAFTVPGARLTFGASFGAFALIALACARASSRRERVARGFFVAVHVWLAFAAFQLALRTAASLEGGVRELAAHSATASGEVVLLRSPFDLLSAYVACLEPACGDGRFAARTLHQLYAGGSELYVERTGQNALQLTATDGFARTPMESIYAARDELPRVGDVRTFGTMRARIVSSTPDGRPRQVLFEFSAPLESSARTFLIWQGAQVTPWQPPPLGQRVHIPALAVRRAFAPR